MKVQGKMFLWLAVFILVSAIVYVLWSGEPTGSVALFMAFGLSLMIGFYLSFTAKRADNGAQDRSDADVADDAGELGFFSPHSWQPLMLATGGALAFLGIIFGWWIMYVAAPVILTAIFGWVFEYYRGADQRY